jgi:Fe2+ or Zn2+ uptake regulation protein
MTSLQPDFKKLLQSRGFKATPGRARLLEVLWRAQRPLTVNELGRKLDLNVVTLYRALNDLMQKGLVMRGIGAAGIEGDMRGDIRATHFSYPTESHHHHLTCIDCGFIRTCNNC